MIETLEAEVQTSQAHDYLLGRCKAIASVASFILGLRQLSEENSNSKLATPMVRSDIADYLGLTIETVSRSFSTLKRNRVIDFRNSREVTVLDIERLISISKGTNC